MKVGIVMPLGIQLGGGEKMLPDLLENARGQGIDWTVFFLQDGPLVEHCRGLGIDVEIVPSGRLRDLYKLYEAVQYIAKSIREKGIEVIVSWMWNAHFRGGLAAQMVGIPAFWYNLEHPHSDTFLRRLVTLIPAKGVLTLSKADYDKQKQLMPNKPAGLIYPGVDLERFQPAILPSPQAAREKLGLPTAGPLIGIVGRMQRWKGIHVLLDAMPYVLKKYPDANCVVVGDRHDFEIEYCDYLFQRIDELGLKEKVHMVGQQQNVPEWTQAMDVVVHASDNEPFGIVVIEAMALGKPLVAGANGGPTEIMTDGVNGLLSPYGDEIQLSEKILRYLDNPEFAQRVGSAAQERAYEFSTKQYATNFISVLQDMCGLKARVLAQSLSH